MMKNWKRLTALLLSGAMALSLFACGITADPTSGDPSAAPSAGDASPDPDPSASPQIVADLTKAPLEFAAGVSPEDVLLTVNGEEVPADLVLYWLNYACYYFMSSYGIYGMSMAEYGDQLIDDAVSICLSEVLLRQKAAQLGCLPTDAQAQQAQAEMEGDPDTLKLFRESYGLTDQSIQYLYLANAYYDNMLAAVTHEPSQEELEDYLDSSKIYRVKHILLKTVDDDHKPLPDDEIAAKKARAEELLSQLQGVAADGLEAKFDELMMANSEDDPQSNPDGYIAGPSMKMVEPFETASMALEEGGLSGIVETEFGYHIILRLPIPEETLAEHRNGFRASSLQAQAEQWQQEAQVVRADALDQLDAADFYARMNAYQTALAERDAPAESGAVG
ncbi:MAG: hypothetical protein HFF28_04485 [Oscillospiraceae bacterium]|nr:hypothetical protein [Oscillospiraceae bacterium]